MKRLIQKTVLLLLIFCLFFSGIVLATEPEVETNTLNKVVNEGIKIPEKNINLKVENLTRGSKVYLLLSENLIKYNIQRFVDNNLENTYSIQAQKAAKIKSFLDNSDYFGYVEYLSGEGFEVEDNQVELRHYCVCLGESQLIGYKEIDGIKYVQIGINLKANSEFELITKDYLVNYDIRDTKFLIDEYGTETIINLQDTAYTTNPEHTNITECNINYSYASIEDYEELEKTIQTTYTVVYIILILIALIIIYKIIKKIILKKHEEEERKFWKKNLTKEEKKNERRKAKAAKREEKLNKRKK